MGMFEGNQFGLQDALAPSMEEFIFFHDYLILVLVFVVTGVGFLIGALATKSFTHRGLLEGQLLEAAWTLVPAYILVAVAAPSLVILYSLDSSACAAITLKAIGHQW